MQDQITEPAHNMARGMTVMSADECDQLLATTPVGRLGFIAEGVPLILPINFAWHDGAIVFRTAGGQKLSAASIRQEVCFEIDSWNTDAETGWSVILRGTSEEVHEPTVIHELADHLHCWSGEADKNRWVMIRPFEISGRRISLNATDPAT